MGGSEGDMREPDWSWTTPTGKVRARLRGHMLSNGADFEHGMRLLEVGCGVGTFTKHFVESGAEVTAIDISYLAIQEARKRIPGASILLRDLQECMGPNYYNAVVGSSVLHHIDIHRGLRKIYTLLKPGGRLCFAEPNLLNPQIWLERKFRRLFWYVEPSETAFTRWWIRDRLIEAGFVDVKVAPFDFLHPLTPKILIPLVDRIGRLLEKIPVIREFAGSLYIRARKPTGG